MTNEHEINQPAIYQIVVQGILDPSWSKWLDGLTITADDNETVLVGSVLDQSALHGILAKINALGLSIVSIERMSQPKKEGVNHG